MRKFNTFLFCCFLACWSYPVYLHATSGENEDGFENILPETELESEISYSRLQKTNLIEKTRLDSIHLLMEQVENNPTNDSLLNELGKLQVKHKMMEEAYLTYSRLIGLNAEHSEACLFLGCYHYIKGKNLLKKEDLDYKAKTNPKRMEYASYQNNVKEILDSHYKIATHYLSTLTSSGKSKLVSEILKYIQHRIISPDPNK